MKKRNFSKLAVVFLLFASCAQKPVESPENDSSAFVSLTDAVPDAILEIRYYGTYNFVGARIDGYEQPTALITREAGAALRAVSDELVAKGYRLKIYDAYRPRRRPLCPLGRGPVRHPHEALLLPGP